MSALANISTTVHRQIDGSRHLKKWRLLCDIEIQLLIQKSPEVFMTEQLRNAAQDEAVNKIEGQMILIACAGSTI